MRIPRRTRPADPDAETETETDSDSETETETDAETETETETVSATGLPQCGITPLVAHPVTILIVPDCACTELHVDAHKMIFCGFFGSS
jgi:hypothetical protein